MTSKVDRATIAADMTSARHPAVSRIAWFLIAPLTTMALGQVSQVTPPDPAPPTTLERALIEHLCSSVLTAAHQECLRVQLDSLRADFGRDLTRLSSAERRALDSACSRFLTEQQREAYLNCLGTQLVALRNRRRPAKPATPDAPVRAAPSMSAPSSSPALPARPGSSISVVWIGAALVTLLVATAGALLAVKGRRGAPRDRAGGLSNCRVCGEEVRGVGDLCQKCRHEAADALRSAAAERADHERALEEEPRRRREDEEDQRRQAARQEEDARVRLQQEARRREEEAREQEMEEARQRIQVTDVADDVFDPYAVLGVPRDASKEAIHSAYLEAKSKYDLDHVAHLGGELQEHFRAKAQAIDRAYQLLTA